jgi:hypothetical protein
VRNPIIRLLSLAFLATLITCSTAVSRIAPQQGHARWEWSLPDSTDRKQMRSGTFMGYVGGDLTHGIPPKSVGSWSSPAENEVQAIVKKGPLVGTIRVKLTKLQPPTFEGEIEHANGKKERIVILLLKDFNK